MNMPRFLLIFNLLLFFMALSVIPADAADLSQWALRNSQLSAVAEGAGVYVAVGKNGFIMRSTDGDHWNPVTPVIDKDLYSIAYGNGVFVAVGGGKTLVSSDGLAWQISTPTAFGANSIAFGGGTFAAIGGTDAYTSTDGISWSTAIATGVTNSLTHITYGNARFVAVGYGGSVITTTTPNVPSWTISTSNTTSALWQVTYNGSDTYVAVGESGRVITSSNALTWTVQSSGVTRTMMAVGFGNGQFVATGSNSSNDAGHIWTSMSGSGSWTEQTSDAYEWFFDVLYAGGKYIIVGGKILSSINAVDWNIVHDATGWDIWGVAYGNGVYVAGTFTGNIITSSNGSQWRETRAADLHSITGLAYSPKDHRFVAAFNNGQLIYSDDGNTWVDSVIASFYLNGIEYLHDCFIGFGSNGGIIISTDGDSWNEYNTGSTASVQAAAYGNNAFVVVGSGTTVYTSDSGVTWVPHSIPSTDQQNGIAYGNGRFIASGYFGHTITSLNGTDWTLGTDVNGGIYNIRFYDGLFLAMGNTSGYIYTSVDGSDWDDVKTPCNGGLYTAEVEGPTLLAAGNSGTIVLVNQQSSLAAAGGGGGGGCFIAALTYSATLKLPVFLMIILAGFIAIRTRKLYKQGEAH